MAHDVAGHAERAERALARRRRRCRRARQRAPRRGRLGHVRERAAVEQEVADVGGVELLLVVQLAGSAADAEAAVARDDPPDEPALLARRGARSPRSR